MADYNSMKVPELKKLLNERGLTQTGNKADLIARLHDDDKAQAAPEEPAGKLSPPMRASAVTCFLGSRHPLRLALSPHSLFVDCKLTSPSCQ